MHAPIGVDKFAHFGNHGILVHKEYEACNSFREKLLPARCCRTLCGLEKSSVSQEYMTTSESDTALPPKPRQNAWSARDKCVTHQYRKTNRSSATTCSPLWRPRSRVVPTGQHSNCLRCEVPARGDRAVRIRQQSLPYDRCCH